MKAQLIKLGLIIMWVTSFATMANAQNMSRYITLNVTAEQLIKLDLRAGYDNTKVKIVSGSKDTTITIGTDWTGFINYYAQADTMRIYGNVERIDCSSNSTKITNINLAKNTNLIALFCSNISINTLNVSYLTQLQYLYCYSTYINELDISKLTQLQALNCYNTPLAANTAALDAIYCSLPNRIDLFQGRIYPLYDASSSNHSAVISTNKANAAAKNWTVRYANSNTDIPATTGNYTCGGTTPTVNMNRYITLNTTAEQWIQLDLKADSTNTKLKVVSGNKDTTLIVGTDYTGFINYYAQADTMRIYGNIAWFNCSDNSTKITGINLSNNTQLQGLYCSNTSISALDISELMQLQILACNGASLSASTEVLNALYCALPNRNDLSPQGIIYPVYDNSSPNHSAVLLTNKANATIKNWAVQYANSNTGIHTTGNYICGEGIYNIGTDNISIKIYPNPTNSKLTIEAEETLQTIELFDLLGKKILSWQPKSQTICIDITKVKQGVYTLKLCTNKTATTFKIVKEQLF